MTAPNVITIARCPDCGLDANNYPACSRCRGPVEQVEMVPKADYDALAREYKCEVTDGGSITTWKPRALTAETERDALRQRVEALEGALRLLRFQTVPWLLGHFQSVNGDEVAPFVQSDLDVADVALAPPEQEPQP